MTDGMMLTWFVLTGLSLAFVAVDIPKTPESKVLKWAFVILTVFTGPFGAFLYVLGCREPLKGTHERYVAATWRQVLGSTMHCAAGDGLGIIAGAAVGARLHLSPWSDFALEYALGFGFGWAYFQAFAMRDMAGGSYAASLRQTFLPELLSMNLLMAGMMPAMRHAMPLVPGAHDPADPAFWFTMSMALMAGFVLAYPMNWWLVVNGLKHGMLTVRPGGGVTMAGEAAGQRSHGGGHEAHGGGGSPGPAALAGMTAASVAALLAGLWLAGGFFG